MESTGIGNRKCNATSSSFALRSRGWSFSHREQALIWIGNEAAAFWAQGSTVQEPLQHVPSGGRSGPSGVRWPLAHLLPFNILRPCELTTALKPSKGRLHLKLRHPNVTASRVKALPVATRLSAVKNFRNSHLRLHIGPLL